MISQRRPSRKGSLCFLCGFASLRDKAFNFNCPMKRSNRAIDSISLPDLEAQSDILPREFYNRSTIQVSRDLLGKILVHRPTAGIIVETEAYLGGEDLASHSARGLTNRTQVIFGPPGHAYVYLIYGMYECLN